ncbi:MAG: hypothetical protein WKF36_12090 [Candidatus Nitrosocosmicus sp.]
MAIEWDYLIIEMVLLAGIIWFTVYIEHFAYRRSQLNEDKKTMKNIIRYIKNDLENRLGFIDESLQFKDYKPFFTDMWDAVILSGKQSLLQFELFQSIQRSYSWMKYYNSELDISKKGDIDEKILEELLENVKKSIEKSISKINDFKKI